MPDVIKLPSIWDYISGAASTGISNYQEAHERLKQQQLQQAGLLSNLFNQGAVDNTDLMPALEKIGVKANIQPNQPQEQRQYKASPDINPKTGKSWTYEERKLAGLPDKSAGIAEQNTITGETIKQKFANGQPLSEREAKFAGLPTDEELTMGRLQTQNKVLAEIGPRYVDLALANYGGKVPSNWNKVVDQAFGAYVADRKRNGMPVDPAQRAFFVSQIFDRMTEQRKLEIDAMNATSARISATRPQIAQADKQFTMLTGVVESRRKALDDFVGTPAGLIASTKAAQPQFQRDPDVQRYIQLQRNLIAAQNAQAQSSGLTAEQRKMLEVGGDAPTSAAPTNIRESTVAAGVQIAKANKQTAAQIREQIKRGRITEAEADEIIRRTGAK